MRLCGVSSTLKQKEEPLKQIEHRQWSNSVYILGTVRPLYRTGVSLLSRERVLYIYSTLEPVTR